MSYDQFVVEQLAGDLLPNATQDQIVATGFLRNAMLNEEGGIDPEQFLMDAMFDRMEAVGKGVLGLTVQCALSDIETLEHGPTQFVPGSHYSGRYPPKGEEAPTFAGRGPTSLLCKAGDIYFTNHQCWHRGAPNTSDRTRYVMQLQYAQRWADARFRGVA